MKLKTVFTITYIAAFLFGLGFIILPSFCLSLMGLNSSGQAPLLARGWGAFILGVFFLAFFSRDLTASIGRKAVVLSLFALYILLDLYKLSLNLFEGIPFNWMIGLLYLLHTFLLLCMVIFCMGHHERLTSKEFRTTALITLSP
jgi:hypothetical protein